MPIVTPIYKSAPILKKRPKPILTKDDMPFESSLVFNASVVKIDGKYLMVFRNDYGTDEENFPKDRCFSGTSIGIAYSDNGIDNWQVRKTPLIDNHDIKEREIRRFYDPRLTMLEGKPYLCFAVDTRHGIRGAIAEVDDAFESFKVISMTVPDNRNMALFPEKIGGKYVRLERPMPVYGRGDNDIFDIWLSYSPDMIYWGNSQLVLDVFSVDFADDKIGPAAPPLKTEKGWLTTFHAVDLDNNRGKNGWEERWPKRYTAGLMLLDLEDPSKVIGRCKTPFIAPDMPYETDEGFRQNVIFPGAMLLEDDGEVKIYYGASDTVECLATAHVDDLIKLCLEGGV